MGALNFDPSAVLANLEKRRLRSAKSANLLESEGRVSSISKFSRGTAEKSNPENASHAAAVDRPSFDRDAFEERAALVEYGAGVPREWAEGFTRLELARRPSGFTRQEWEQLLNDGGRFLDAGWAEKAATVSWSATDVFGVHPRAPMARFDAMGLVLLIRGGEVIDLYPDRAVICSSRSSNLTYYLRRYGCKSIPIWELASL